MPDNLIRILTLVRDDQLEALRIRRALGAGSVAEQVRDAIDVALEAPVTTKKKVG